MKMRAERAGHGWLVTCLVTTVLINVLPSYNRNKSLQYHINAITSIAILQVDDSCSSVSVTCKESYNGRI